MGRKTKIGRLHKNYKRKHQASAKKQQVGHPSKYKAEHLPLTVVENPVSTSNSECLTISLVSECITVPSATECVTTPYECITIPSATECITMSPVSECVTLPPASGCTISY